MGRDVAATTGPLPVSTVVTASAHPPQSTVRVDVTVALYAVDVPVVSGWWKSLAVRVMVQGGGRGVSMAAAAEVAVAVAVATGMGTRSSGVGVGVGGAGRMYRLRVLSLGQQSKKLGGQEHLLLMRSASTVGAVGSRTGGFDGGK